jgi:hypothetical protein
MLKKTIFGLFLFTALLTGLGGCGYDNFEEIYPPDPAGCDTSAVSFAADIVPIMTGSCSSLSAGCHGPGNFNNAQLDTYEGVKLEVDNGKLISSITWDGVATQSQMPSGSSTKIEDCLISKIQSWVAAGAPNN